MYLGITSLEAAEKHKGTEPIHKGWPNKPTMCFTTLLGLQKAEQCAGDILPGINRRCSYGRY